MSCRGVVSALLCVIAVSTVEADVVSVAVVGPGTGTVESSPPGISCPGTCSARFPSGSQVTLTATADQGSRFDTWSAACGGSASGCTVSVRPNLGVIASFRATGDPHSVVHHFAPPVVDGAYPASGRPVSDGVWLYGTTLQGGLNGVGTIYRQRLDGLDFEVLHSFSSSATTGSEPRGSLTLDGTVLYGTTLRGGAADAGTVFRIGTDGSDFAVLHSFSGSTGDGSSPRGALAIGDGVLYGTTSRGGASGFGTVFRIDSDGSDFALLHSFTTSGADGSEPEGSLVLDGGVLYGMTPRGGASNAGTVFRIGADGSGFATLHSFSGTASDGANPYGSLTLAGDVLYGMTSDGGPSGDGTVFRIGTGGSGFALLHSFAGSAIEGARPYGSLTLSGQSLYGMTRYGGEWGKGTVFSIHTDGSDFTSLHVFSGGTADRNPDGGEPLGSLALVGGVLYGATSSGGPPGDGTVFTLKTNGSDFALLHSFGSPVSDGRRPLGSLIPDGGALYGMTSRGGVSDLGAIFRVGADGSDFSVLHSFRRADGRSPHGSLTLVDDVLYGITRGGGAADAGTIFRIDVDGSGFAVLHAFSGGPDDGGEPWGTLTPYGGSLFGTTSRGGASDLGTVFRIDTDGSDFALLHSFAGGAVDGASPLGGLTAESGVLYGMTRTGGASGVGTLFRIDTDGSDFALLHSFGLALSDGRYPFGSLVADDGVLYGMTSMGGDTGFYGAVFRVDTDGTDFALLHSFTGSPFDGDTPLGSLTLAGGVLYGTTSGGGVSDPGTLTGDGAVFRINPDGTGFEVLHSFGSDPATGRVPMYGSLVADGGFLYGMTSRGGDSDEGAVFRIDPAGTVVEPVHSFGSPGGRSPSGSLASDGDALYGMTELGGTWHAGTLYSVDRDGSDFAILHSFPPSGDASARPRFSLTPGGGALYGVTRRGGSSDAGTVFRIDSDGSDFTSMHSFANSATDGGFPTGALILDGGVLYGMTHSGGASGAGTVFRISTGGSGFEVLHSFSGTASGGGRPYGSLTLGDGVLYGIAGAGGASGEGAVFRIGTDGSGFELLHPFADSPMDQDEPYGSLALAGGFLYGVSWNGGAAGDGAVFRVGTDGSDFALLHSFSGADGRYPYGSLTVHDGGLYGATSTGGAFGKGTIFRIGIDGSGFSVLHSFKGHPEDGDGPLYGAPVVDGGTLYAATQRGGAARRGAIVALDLSPDVTPPTNPTIDATDPPVSSWSNRPAVELFFSGAADDEAVAGYSILFDQSPSTEPDDTLEVLHSTDPHSFTSPPLGDGASWYGHLKTCDTSGNCSAAIHVGPFRLDTVAPAPPVVASIADDTGSDPSDGITSDPTLVFSGEAEPNASVELLVDGGTAGVTAADAAGDWTIDLTSTPFSDGTFAITAVATDAAGNVSDPSAVFVLTVDATPPRVVRIETVARSESGFLADGASTATGITQLGVVFDDAMEAPMAPADFRLISRGTSGEPPVVDCASPPNPGDVELGVSEVSYRDAESTAWLSLASGRSLAVGDYDVVACAAVRNRAGAGLDGDGDGSPGGDHHQSFRVRWISSLANPNFDRDLTGWTIEPSGSMTVSHAPADSDGLPTSGSLRLDGVVDPHELTRISQCVDAPSPDTYVAAIRVQNRSEGETLVVLEAVAHPDVGCGSGAAATVLSRGHPVPQRRAGWTPIGDIVTIPDSTASVELVLRIAPLSESGRVDLLLDTAALAVPVGEPLFVDGFETGDTGFWSDAVPGP